MNEKELWEKCVAFHGHSCGGLTIGFKAALLAVQLLDIGFSSDEEIVCISENDACGVDAIQVILGCTLGKGNLQFHITGKSAYSFYNRKTGASVRLRLNNTDIPREQSFSYYQSLRPEEMFTAMPTRLELPQRARLFESFVCESCGEKAGTNWLRLKDGKQLCLDCELGSPSGRAGTA